MTSTQPPKLATWILQHLGCGSDNDAVIGDLAERYRQGKTSAWYWRETVVAIVVSAFNDIRSHKLLTLRAMIVGGPTFWYLGYWAFDVLALFTRAWTPDRFYSAIGPWLGLSHEQFVALYWYCDSAAGTVLMVAIGMISGWILARLNWRHRRSIVLLFSFSVLLSWIYYSWTATVDDIGASLYWEAYFWTNNILQVLGVLVGGLMAIHSSYPTRLKNKLRQVVQAVPLKVFPILLLAAAVITCSQSRPLVGQDTLGRTIQGIVMLEGTSDPIPDVQITVVAQGSLAATGFTAQQVLNAVARGAAVNPELVQIAQDATRGGPKAALATAAPMTTVSDSTGHFTVANVSPGEYFVRAQLQNYFGPATNGTRSPIATVNAIVGQQTTEVRISLIRGGTISGSVLDPGGKPLLNSPVQALRGVYDGGSPVLETVNLKPTDDRGAFRLGVLAPGEYFVAVTPMPGGARGAPVPAASTTGEVPVTTLYPGAIDLSKAVPIVLHGGEDLSGMNIQLKTAPSSKINGKVTSTLPPGPAPGGRGGTRPLIATLALAPRNKTEVPDITGGVGAVSANEDGTFEILNVPPGAYDLFARLPIANGWGALAPPERATAPWALGRTSIDVRRGSIDGATILVHQGIDIKGRVTVDGQPTAANIRISLLPADSATRVNENQISQVFGQIAQYPTRIEQDGSFTIPVVPEGQYQFQIAFSGPASANSYVTGIRQGNVNVYDDGLTVGREPLNPIEISVYTNGGIIEGTVLGTDRKPVPRTSVVVVPTQTRRQNVALYKTVQSDAQGHFTITGIAPGDWKVFAWESVQAGAYQNAEFMRRFEERGTGVSVAAGLRSSAEVIWIRN